MAIKIENFNLSDYFINQLRIGNSPLPISVDNRFYWEYLGMNLCYYSNFDENKHILFDLHEHFLTENGVKLSDEFASLLDKESFYKYKVEGKGGEMDLSNLVSHFWILTIYLGGKIFDWAVEELIEKYFTKLKTVKLKDLGRKISLDWGFKALNGNIKEDTGLIRFQINIKDRKSYLLLNNYPTCINKISDKTIINLVDMIKRQRRKELYYILNDDFKFEKVTNPKKIVLYHCFKELT